MGNVRKEQVKNKQWSFWALIGILLLLGVGFILASQYITNEFLKASCSNIASAIIVAGIFSAVNEKIVKDNLIELILSKIKLKQEIDATGIEEVFTDISDVDYRYYLKGAKKNIDILHVYGRTWTTNNLDDIKDKLLNSNCDIRVILVDPESPFIEGLAKFYGVTSDDLKQKIQEVSAMWKDLHAKKSVRKRKPTQSSIKLYYHKSQPASAVYRIDDRIINVQNKFISGRSKKLTTIVCNDTSRAYDIYNNFLNEIEELVSNSKEISLE
jgi:hypothetical protein